MLKSIVKAYVIPALMALSLLIPLAPAFAQSSCEVNGQPVECPQWFNTAAPIIGGVMTIVILAATVFWVMMLIHAIRHPIPNKALWILIILFGNTIGALVYYFVVKKKAVTYLQQ